MTIWTPKTEQSETWTLTASNRVFDPAVFDNNPVFDTSLAGIWNDRTKQAEVWTEV